MNKNLIGHLAAIITVSIWGTTFISTKILLRTFTPVEILLMRFVIGYVVLWILCPHRLKLEDRKQEIYYAGAGLTGITIYYLMENIALTYTLAANVGVIIATAPFFTALLEMFFGKKKEKVYWTFFLGFVVALVGIFFISFNGSRMQLNPLGDLLTIGAAFAWAVYSMFLKKINTLGHSSLLNTRHIFAWGIGLMIPAIFVLGFHPAWEKLLLPINFGNLLFLGVGACAGCFAVWNYAVNIIGALKANVYIYLDPVVTVAVSATVLKEPITPLILLGTILTLAGLMISEIQWKTKDR